MNLPGSRRVLVVAYIFPPLGGSGVYRTAKFAKYLPGFGWQPVVVCGGDPEPFATGLDESLLAEIPQDAAVVRVPHVSARGPRRWVMRWLGMKDEGGRACPELVEGTKDEGGVWGELASRHAVVRALNALLAPVEFPPIDDGLYWALRIVPRCLRLIREHQVKAIYTTSFPYSDHIAGLILKRLTGLPWVADFRDPWSQNAAVRMTGWRRWCDVAAERRVLRAADRVIGVTPSYTAALHALAPGRSSEHFATIENGYDAADFVPDSSQNASSGILSGTEPPGSIGGGVQSKDAGRVTLAHVGYVYPGTAIPFLDLLREDATALAGLRLRFTGRLPEPDASWLAGHPLPGRIEVRERVPHAEAIREMRTAGALLLLSGHGPEWEGHYPGKLFEYMAAGRPILLVGAEGDASRLLAASGTGIRLPLEQPEEAAALLRLLARDPAGFRARYYHPDPQVIARYERRALAGRLAGLLDQVVAERSETT